MHKTLGLLLLLISLLSFLVAIAAVVAMARSLTVETTLSAVESFFGTLVVTLFFILLGYRTFKSGRARLTDHREDPDPAE